MPKLWLHINLGIVIVALIAPFVASLIVPSFTIFMGFSISAWLFALVLLAYGYGKLIVDYKNLKRKPVFFSPWIFPIFKFDPKKQDVVPHNLPGGCIILGNGVMICWSALATVWIQPVHVGVSLSILFMFILLLTIIFMIQISHLQLRKLSKHVDNKIIRRAWIESKNMYVQNRNAFNRDELVTYEEYWTRKNVFRNKMRLMQGRNQLSLEERVERVELL